VFFLSEHAHVVQSASRVQKGKDAQTEGIVPHKKNVFLKIWRNDKETIRPRNIQTPSIIYLFICLVTTFPSQLFLNSVPAVK
jgi:hypothetical protein